MQRRHPPQRLLYHNPCFYYLYFTRVEFFRRFQRCFRRNELRLRSIQALSDSRWLFAPVLGDLAADDPFQPTRQLSLAAIQPTLQLTVSIKESILGNILGILPWNAGALRKKLGSPATFLGKLTYRIYISGYDPRNQCQVIRLKRLMGRH